MAIETVFDFNINLTQNADISIEYQGIHGYYGFSGSEPWGMSCYLDGQQIKQIGGSAGYTETPIIIGGRKNIGAGSRNIKVTWFGSSKMTLSQSDIVVGIRYR
jgi:hypothetical protein